MKIPVNRKESYVGDTPPNSQESADLFSKTKIVEEEEEVPTILLLDTPQSTPVGSPEPQTTSSLIDIKPEDPDYETAEAFEQLVISDTDEASSFIPSSTVKRSEPQAIEAPANQRPRRRKKRASESFSDCFCDNYQMVDDLLGEGACGSVATCINLVSGGEFAVKTVVKTSSRTREKIFREIDILYQCRKHINVVQLITFFEEGDRFLLIFEKGFGGSLLSYIQMQKEFTEYDASIIIKDVANALKFLHSKGMAHRDLKPDNILCHSMTEASPVKLCDFDLASGVKESDDNPVLLSPVGSATFMAPEVVNGFVGRATPYDKRCDLWSLGVVMYVVLCGYPPFNETCDAEHCPPACLDCENALFQSIQSGKYSFPDNEWRYVSSAAKDLINHLLVKEVNQRYLAENVLQHPWVSYGGPDTELYTPSVLCSYKSSTELRRIADSCNAFQRDNDRYFTKPSSLEESDCSPSCGTGNFFRFSPLSDSSLLIRRQRGSQAEGTEFASPDAKK